MVLNRGDALDWFAEPGGAEAERRDEPNLSEDQELREGPGEEERRQAEAGKPDREPAAYPAGCDAADERADRAAGERGWGPSAAGGEPDDGVLPDVRS